MLGARRFRHALVLGPFYPPHAGHHYLIRTAARDAERTTVAVLASAGEAISLADRVYWLAAEHWSDPGVSVLGDYTDGADQTTCAGGQPSLGVVHSVLARRAMRDGDPSAAPVDAVFTSARCADRGRELAARLGARHVAVDPVRSPGPVSGAVLRADLLAHWHHLAAATKAGLSARVVVLGAESTGATTLSEQLAAYYRQRGGPFRDTLRVTENGRPHAEEKLTAEQALAAAGGLPPPTLAGLRWTVGDFIDVARRAAIAEDDAAGRGGPILFCDNDPWAASLWCEGQLGTAWTEVRQIGGDRRPALYLLTDHVGMPAGRDGWRPGEHRREWLTARFVRGLGERGVPWVLLTGSRRHRLRRAIRACEELLGTHFRLAEPSGGSPAPHG